MFEHDLLVVLQDKIDSQETRLRHALSLKLEHAKKLQRILATIPNLTTQIQLHMQS